MRSMSRPHIPSFSYLDSATDREAKANDSSFLFGNLWQNSASISTQITNYILKLVVTWN